MDLHHHLHHHLHLFLRQYQLCRETSLYLFIRLLHSYKYPLSSAIFKFPLNISFVLSSFINKKYTFKHSIYIIVFQEREKENNDSSIVDVYNFSQLNSCISRKFSFFTISIDKVIIIFWFIHYFIEKHIYIYRQDQFSFTIFLFESFGNCFSVSVTFVELYDQKI